MSNKLNCTPEAFAKKCLSYKGYLEKKSNKDLESFTANAGSNNYTRFNRDYGKYTGVGETYWQAQAWCAMFTNVCLVEAFNGDVKAAKEALYGSFYCSCTAGYNNFKKNNAISKNPQVGAMIFFKKTATSSNTMSHTGVVYAYDDYRVYTIEGNTSITEGVVANGGGVNCKSYARNYNHIGGYGILKGFNNTGNANAIYEDNSITNLPTTQVNKTYIIVNTSSLNYRSGPGTNYTKLGNINLNDEVLIEKRSSNNWGYCKKLNAWLSMSYLKEKAVAKPNTGINYKCTAKSGLRVRSGHNESYAIINSIKYGEIVQVTKTSNGWGYISSKKGWASLTWLKKV